MVTTAMKVLKILMVDPEFFDVVYSINPHMTGNIGNVDRTLARKQWGELKQAYEKIGLSVAVLPGAPGLPDMVFAANQTFPFVDPRGKKKVILSQMHAAERKKEVALFAAWFQQQGYQTISLKTDTLFEGMGDLLWHVGHQKLWGGYGFRTDARVYEEIGNHIGLPVLRLELIDPRFYHLDTCLAPITNECALYFPKAFTGAGQKLLQQHFSDLIEVTECEARQGFACNGHCPDGKHFLLQKGSSVVCEELRKRGMIPVELETSEFLKSGGSVFCLKMML